MPQKLCSSKCLNCLEIRGTVWKQTNSYFTIVWTSRATWLSIIVSKWMLLISWRLPSWVLQRPLHLSTGRHLRPETRSWWSSTNKTEKALDEVHSWAKTLGFGSEQPFMALLQLWTHRVHVATKMGVVNGNPQSVKFISAKSLSFENLVLYGRYMVGNLLCRETTFRGNSVAECTR